jgi:hypothetical protein
VAHRGLLRTSQDDSERSSHLLGLQRTNSLVLMRQTHSVSSSRAGAAMSSDANALRPNICGSSHGKRICKPSFLRLRAARMPPGFADLQSPSKLSRTAMSARLNAWSGGPTIPVVQSELNYLVHGMARAVIRAASAARSQSSARWTRWPPTTTGTPPGAPAPSSPRAHEPRVRIVRLAHGSILSEC